VNIFQHDYLKQWKGVFSGIVDYRRGAEYTLSQVTKVRAGPDQPVVYAHDIFSILVEPQHHLNDVPYMPGDPNVLHAPCPLIL
jgi:hypothetical protein